MDDIKTVVYVKGNTLSFEKNTESINLVFETNSDTDFFLVNMLIKTGYLEKCKYENLVE